MQTIRRLITAIFVIIAFVGNSQVPDTETFSLQDVVNEVNPSSNDLITCFDESVLAGFDDQYIPSGFDPDAPDKSGYELYYFRNYYHAFIDISPDSYDVDPNGETFTITVDAKAGESWTVTVDKDWINPSQTTGTGDATFDVTIDVNDTGSDRGGDLIVILDDYNNSDNCLITQNSK
jgi:hypothetical protein